MNKLIENTEELNSTISILEIAKEQTCFRICDSVKIEKMIFPNFFFHSTWILEENAVLEICSVFSCENIHGVIEIISTHHTKCFLYLGLKMKGMNHLELLNTVQGNQNQSEIKIRVIGEENSETKIKTSGILEKNSLGNEFLEEVKYLNETTSQIVCLPELIVSSNDAKATHNVTMASVLEEELFYLQSKGLSEEKAKNLIRECFLNAVFYMRERKEDKI